MRWGAAEEDLVRDAPSMYADGIALPAGVCTPEQKQNGNCRYMDAVNGFGSNRPSPRKISNELFQQVGYTRIWVYDDIRGIFNSCIRELSTEMTNDLTYTNLLLGFGMSRELCGNFGYIVVY